MGSRRTKHQLQNVTDYAGFESLCHDLMIRHGYEDIEPLGGFQDKGRDAIHVSKKTGAVTIFAYSVREDWQKKLAEDLNKIRSHGHLCNKVVFLTTQNPTPEERDSWIKKAKLTYGWDLELHGLERIATSIDGPCPELKRLHPNIFFLEPQTVTQPVVPIKDRKNWIDIANVVFEVPLRKASQVGKFDDEALNARRLFRAHILQATARAFSITPAIETTVLLTCNVNPERLFIEIKSHRFALLRWIKYFGDPFFKDEPKYQRQWKKFNAEWPSTEDSDLPVNATLFPLGISFIRDAGLIQFRKDLITSSIELPKTTDDFLKVIGIVANAQFAIMNQIGPAGHPFNRLFCFMADNDGLVDLERLKVNPSNVDEYDYVYSEYEQELGLA